MDACTDDDGNWRMAPLLRQPRPGGADAEWRARQPQDPAVRRAPVPGQLDDVGRAASASAGEPLDEAARQADMPYAPRGVGEAGTASLDAAGAARRLGGEAWYPRRILEVGPGPTDSADIALMQRFGERTMLQVLHEMYPEAQLGAADIDPLVLDRIRRNYIETGQLPESTVLANLSYTDPDLVRTFGRSDLVVNVAPSPRLIAAGGGETYQEQAMRYVRSLLELTEPGGRVYVAVDPTTLGRYRQPLEEAFWTLAGAEPVYHRGGSIGESALLPLQDVYSGWINRWFEVQTWVEYLAVRR